MPIKVTCNSCGGVLHAPDDAAGKRGRCPTCQMILTIPAAGAPPLEPATAPVPVSSTYNVAPSEPPPYPKPPAFGDDSPLKFGAKPAKESRVPPPEPRRQDPFAKPGKPKPPEHHDPAHKWRRVYKGLGLARWGVLFMTLGVLVPCVIKILQAQGVSLPDKNPGLLQVNKLSMMSEVKFAAPIVFITLGGLMVLFGRFRVASMPHESGTKGLAVWSMLFTLLAFFGWLAVTIFLASAVINESPPSFEPKKVVPVGIDRERKPNTQERVGAYLQQLHTLSIDDFPGQAQRIGLMVLIVAGLTAELWFLGVIARISAHCQCPWATARVNRLLVLLGLFFLLLCTALLVHNMYDRGWFTQNVMQKYRDLEPKMQATVFAGTIAGIAVVASMMYCRLLGGARGALREAGSV